MEDMKKFLLKRIAYVEARIDAIKKARGNKPDMELTYHAGWGLGYWEGKLSAYTNILDKLEEAQEE